MFLSERASDWNWPITHDWKSLFLSQFQLIGLGRFWKLLNLRLKDEDCHSRWVENLLSIIFQSDIGTDGLNSACYPGRIHFFVGWQMKWGRFYNGQLIHSGSITEWAAGCNCTPVISMAWNDQTYCMWLSPSTESKSHNIPLVSSLWLLFTSQSLLHKTAAVYPELCI